MACLLPLIHVEAKLRFNLERKCQSQKGKSGNVIKYIFKSIDFLYLLIEVRILAGNLIFLNVRQHTDETSKQRRFRSVTLFTSHASNIRSHGNFEWSQVHLKLLVTDIFVLLFDSLP